MASWYRKVQGACFLCAEFISIYRMIVGVISDTHGLLRDEAVNALHGSEHIIHAGDVGQEEILQKLATIAPVTAIRGNVDTEAWTKQLPLTNVVELGSVFFYVVHDAKSLDLNPRAAGFGAVISGHSHMPKIEWRQEVLFFNPGSAGPRRFRLPISIGRIRIEEGKLLPELIKLG